MFHAAQRRFDGLHILQTLWKCTSGMPQRSSVKCESAMKCHRLLGAAAGGTVGCNCCNVAAGAVASLKDTSTPLGKAVRILNNQLQALMSIDERADALEARLEQLGSAGNGVAAA